METVNKPILIFMSTVTALIAVCASAIAGESTVAPPVVAAAKQFQGDIRSINSKLTDPKKQRFTDVSKTVEKYIAIGSSISDAEALMQALGCKPPLRLNVEESNRPRHYRRPSCTSTVTANANNSQSLSALLELPGSVFQGHFLMIDAQASGSDQNITSVRATIDIRTSADL